jgi:hypothetical protein
MPGIDDFLSMHGEVGEGIRMKQERTKTYLLPNPAREVITYAEKMADAHWPMS